MKLIESIAGKTYVTASEDIKTRLETIKESKLAAIKKKAALHFSEMDISRLRRSANIEDRRGETDVATNSPPATNTAVASPPSTTSSQVNREKKQDRLREGAAVEKDLQDHEPRVVIGVKGMKSKDFRKKFSNAASQKKWEDSDDYGNHTVHYVQKLDEARIKLVKLRIRGGKIQRRKKVSNVKGMTIRGGRLTRMTAGERRRRKMGARRAAIKARGKRSQVLRKRKMSLMKRKRLGG